MFSFIRSWLNYFSTKHYNDDFEDDDYKENYLAEQLIDLEYVSKQEEKIIAGNEIVKIPNNTFCFQRTGVITFKDNCYILIDGMYYLDTTTCAYDCNVNDQVLYLGYKDYNDDVVVVRILENKGLYWGEDDNKDEDKFQITDHVLVGEVDHRKDRYVYIKESDLKFNLDNVEGTFIPIKGDWLEMKCTIHIDNNKPSDITLKQVLSVTSFKPLRTKVTSTYIKSWMGTYGICDKMIYFEKSCMTNSFEPEEGSKLLVEAIESNQNMCTWRAIKVKEIQSSASKRNHKGSEENMVTLQLEKEKNIFVTYPLVFEQMHLNQKSEMILNVTNNSNEKYILNKWIMLSRKRDSQIIIEPILTEPIKLIPGKSTNFTVTCCPNLPGKTKECLILSFRGFQIKRYIEISVVEENIFLLNCLSNNSTRINISDKIKNIHKIRNNKKLLIHGERIVKPPAFVSVRIGEFSIPEKIWDVVLGDCEQTIYSNDYNKITELIEHHLPCLSKPLSGSNYIDKWHTLLYMEEIQANINMRVFDIPKVFLIRCQEYLCVEINGLAERRPSLMKGDRAIITDLWINNSPQYEGYIHSIKGVLVMMKFNSLFHEIYNGGDVSIEFHFGRAAFRRSHQAINYAISNLGLNILFPSHIHLQKPQLPKENIEKIQWFNKNLNNCQKMAVVNVLLGESRPMPYCILGPPGTGKTITITELILQILSVLPESRILVATPSNSAADLVTERIVHYQNKLNGSIVRLIAHHMVDSESIPNIIKPFCATLDIAEEKSSKSKHTVKNEMNLNCQKTFFGRHRVTIGTCNCLGSLAQIGLPKGHFTHVIIDEAGQCTEPETMIPMTFIDKDSGQIVLAGDPMQLGPVVISKYCKDYGMGESYMSRILQYYPYQTDYASFQNGYDNRLITKLNDNYRSLEEVISLPSEMFYNASLVPKMNRNQPWISKIIAAISDIFGLDNAISGGIFVYGVRGDNAKAMDSPSWYNPQEASMVAFTTCKLLKRDVRIDEIGIITSYVAQVKYLRLLFDSMGLPHPKIGTVEEFQGQERPVILISTVRSSESLLQEDNKHTLGFVKNPKRLNVAITRAQVATILFCNPHLFCTDSLWKRVIVHAVKKEKYMGCDLPVLNS